MLRDPQGDRFFGFCGMRVNVPDDDPNAESPSEAALRVFRERLREATDPRARIEAPRKKSLRQRIGRRSQRLNHHYHTTTERHPMKHSLLLLAAALALAGCATQSPETAAATATICAMHKDAATVAAVNDVTGIDAKTAAEKKLALDLLCAMQASAPPK